MEQPTHRFHGKVMVTRGSTEVHVNVFDDNREVVYQEIQQAIAQFSPDIKPAVAARRELERAAARPVASTKPPAAPACQECGTNEAMELITWKDKATGERKKAWKCQACEKWAR